MQQLTKVDQATIDRAVEFHGDLCPGIATGIQVSELALREFGRHGPDNKLIAVVENETCAVDAIQVMVGCTTGQRNLVHRDWGKIGYSFYRPADGRAIRISGPPPWERAYQELRFKVLDGKASAAEAAELKERSTAEAHRILDIPPEDLFHVEELHEPMPATPRVDPWHTCAECGEPMMETRSRQFHEHELCIPCFEKTIYGGLRTYGI